MRRLLIAFALLSLLVYALLAWGAWASRDFVKLAWGEIESEGKPWQDLGRETKTFSVPAGRRLVVTNVRGDVKITPGGNEVVVDAVYSARGETLAAAKRRAPSLSLIAAPQGDDTFRLSCPAADDRRLKCDLTLRLPPHQEVQLDTVAGNLEVSGLKAAVSIANRAGNVRVARCDGPISVTNSAGNTEVATARQAVTVTSSAGEIVLRDLRGSVNATNSAGNIELRDAKSDAIHLANSAGNIEVTLSHPFTGQLTARTRAGNVAISLPRSSRCRVETRASLGQITNSLPAEVTAGDPPGLIDASASMGNVEITVAE